MEFHWIYLVDSGPQIMYINLRNIQAGKILGVLLHELLEMIFYGNLTI